MENWVELIHPNSKDPNTWNSIKEDMVKIHDMVHEAESNKKTKRGIKKFEI
jgi:hypothetical protein